MITIDSMTINWPKPKSTKPRARRYALGDGFHLSGGLLYDETTGNAYYVATGFVSVINLSEETYSISAEASDRYEKRRRIAADLGHDWALATWRRWQEELAKAPS